MKLRELWLSLSEDDRKALAVKCRTTYAHLRNVVYGKSCSAKLAVDLERESDGRLKVEQLCPGVDWAYLRKAS
ncbi:helix-turn-helix domain-containing protein [Leeia sp. TBRC 13508]|uniref:Helix-turn-helix domain-containing protein n=1 Tax=Leeia speluncae TaxID=2884804 RepID=A0ABS8D7S7_9NEIS|nr:helix-turn-helix domain-containing protein [Leeia speluncae]